jgi:5-methylcytosine-specific restriction endonuclease McrA
MELVETLQCGCNPSRTYASRATLRAHLTSNRHRAWAADRARIEAAKSETGADILRRRLDAAEAQNRALALRVAELEEAIFSLRVSRRSVSETKKKRVAAEQAWRCAGCSDTLSHVFEVDHRTPLFAGGDNSEANLQALCRECHGKKTLADREAYRVRAPMNVAALDDEGGI